MLPQFRDTIDGLVFGVTAGVGFACAEGLVGYWSLFSYPPSGTDAATWIFPITSLALLVPLLHGSTSGAITATLWRPSRTGTGRWVSLFGVPVVVVAVGGVLCRRPDPDRPRCGAADRPASTRRLWHSSSILYIRHLVHHSLMEEGQDQAYRPIVCPHCHHHVMAAGFCPSCGVALSASPRRETGSLPAGPVPAAAQESE